MLERIDLQVCMDRPEARLLLDSDSGDQPSSAQVCRRIGEARERAQARQGCLNAQLQSRLIQVVRPESETLALLRSSSDRLALSPRLTTRLLKVARSVADLAATEQVQPCHLAEAFALRLPDQLEDVCAS